MKNGSTNIYKFARITAGLTQEYAAKQIGVSIRSLIAYENYERVPSDLIVHKMIECYRTRYLSYLHLKRNSDLGRYLPDICFTNLAQSVIALKNEMEDVMSIDRRIREIARDGYVSEDEIEDWEKIVKEIDDVAAAALALVFMKNSKELV